MGCKEKALGTVLVVFQIHFSPNESSTQETLGPEANAIGRVTLSQMHGVCSIKSTAVEAQFCQGAFGGNNPTEQALEIYYRRVVQVFMSGPTGILDQGYRIAAIRGFARRGIDTHVGRDAAHIKLILA